MQTATWHMTGHTFLSTNFKTHDFRLVVSSVNDSTTSTTYHAGDTRGVVFTLLVLAAIDFQHGVALNLICSLLGYLHFSIKVKALAS